MDLGESGNFQSGLVLANNTLFATTEKNTFAIDPATCQQKWKHTYDKPMPEGLKVNRGVAFADGKVFRGVNAGYLIAIDANSGQQLWETKIAEPDKGGPCRLPRRFGTEWSLLVRRAVTTKAFAAG